MAASTSACGHSYKYTFNHRHNIDILKKYVILATHDLGSLVGVEDTPLAQYRKEEVMTINVHFKIGFSSSKLFDGSPDSAWKTGSGQKSVQIGHNPADALTFLRARRLEENLPHFSIACVAGKVTEMRADRMAAIHSGDYRFGDSQIAVYKDLIRADITFVCMSVGEFERLARLLLAPSFTTDWFDSKLPIFTPSPSGLADRIKTVQTKMRPKK